MQYSRSSSEIEDYDENCALRELQYYLNGNDNALNYDIINYERLFYIEEFLLFNNLLELR